MISTKMTCNLAEVACTFNRYQAIDIRFSLGQIRFENGVKKLIGTQIVKMMRTRSEDRHLIWIFIKKFSISLHGFAHLAQSIKSTALIKFINHHKICEI